MRSPPTRDDARAMHSHSRYGTAREVSDFGQTQSQPQAQCSLIRSVCAARMITTSPPPTDTDRRAEAARLAQRHNEALAKKPADNPRFKPAANVPGQGFVIVGTKR
jgi:hypothetical protein